MAETGVRLDRWLWAARFFKTRSLASEAVRGGHAQVNGARAKPSRMVKTGETVSVSKGEQRFLVVVDGLSDTRGPASVAQTLYHETQASAQARAEQRAMRRQAQLAPILNPGRRPDKKQRRAIQRARGRRD